MVVWQIPQIRVALETLLVDYEPSMIELYGKIFSHPVSILIDPRECHSYISPLIIKKTWFKIKFSIMVGDCWTLVLSLMSNKKQDKCQTRKC